MDFFWNSKKIFLFLPCFQTEWCEIRFLFLFWIKVRSELPNRRISIQLMLFQSRFLSDILNYVFPLLCLTPFQSLIVGPFSCMLSSFSSWLNSNFIWTFASMYANCRKKYFAFILKLEHIYNKMFPFHKREIATTPSFVTQKDFKCYTFKYTWDTH